MGSASVMSADSNSSAMAMGRVGGYAHGAASRVPPAAPQRNPRRYHRRNNMNRNNFFGGTVSAAQLSGLQSQSEAADSSMDTLQALQHIQHDMTSASDVFESSSSLAQIHE